MGIKSSLFVMIVPALLLAGPLWIGPAAAHDNAGTNGPAMIDIDGGSRGPITFTHRDHQKRLGDCNRCHELFPKQHNSLMKLKKAGRLTPKKVMNKLCIKCHKAEKLAGKPSGPTTCSKCHTRK